MEVLPRPSQYMVFIMEGCIRPLKPKEVKRSQNLTLDPDLDYSTGT